MDMKLMTGAGIFSSMTDAELAEALNYLGARESFYRKGQYLISIGDSIGEFALVESGMVQVSSYDINGNIMIMNTVTRGKTFAESLAVTGTEDSPICARAVEDTRVVWLSAAPIRRNNGNTPLHTKIVSNFISEIAHKCLGMNERIQILSKRTIREKVITYLSQLSEASRRDEFTIPFDRQDLASYLGVERSALSRELSRMARDGLISFRKNTFRIL